MSAHRPLAQSEINRMKLKPIDIARLLTARRVAENLNQRQLSDRIGVSQATLCRWERGDMDPTTMRVLNWLLGGEDSINEMWRIRALIAEATIKDILDATREYREASQLRAGGQLSNGGRPT